MSESRWFRVNCDWSDSEWIYVLSAEARLAWIMFLGRVKTHGFGGRLKQVPTALLARQWLIGEEAVIQILKAAQNNGAITLDGDSWVVENWAKYQGDTSNSARQKSHRDRKKQSETDELGSTDKESNGSNALRNGVTTTKTKTKTETIDIPPVSPLGDDSPPEKPPKAVRWWESVDEPCRGVLCEIATVSRFEKYLVKNKSRSLSEITGIWLKASQKVTADRFLDESKTFASYYRTRRQYDDGVAAFRNWLNRSMERLPDLPKPAGSVAPVDVNSESVASLVRVLKGMPAWKDCSDAEITNEAIRRINSGGEMAV